MKMHFLSVLVLLVLYRGLSAAMIVFELPRIMGCVLCRSIGDEVK